MNYIIWTGIIIGFAYFLVSIIYAGISSSFAWFWFGIGLVSLIIQRINLYMIQQGIEIPHNLQRLVRCTIAVGFFVFIWVEGIIIVNANQKPKSNADYVIILGAKVRGTTITKSLKARLDTAYDYLIENPNTVAIVSGGKGPGEDISEAAAMEKYLKQKGIDKKRIQLEDKSVNTHQNIKFSRRIAQNDDASFVVVTNGFHIYRATRIARKQGLKRVEGLSAPCDKIMLISYYVREGFAVVKYKLSGMI